VRRAREARAPIETEAPGKRRNVIKPLHLQRGHFETDDGTDWDDRSYF
jgi:hypothetical protein